MKWGFVLVTLYMGPIGLLLYVMADIEPAPGTHENFVKPLEAGCRVHTRSIRSVGLASAC